MRSNIPFDTHAFVKELVAAGVPEPQAEVHARLLGDVVIERLATKDDLALLRQKLRADMGLLRQELRGDMGELRGDMGALELRLTLRFGAMLAAAVGITVALVKLL